MRTEEQYVACDQGRSIYCEKCKEQGREVVGWNFLALKKVEANFASINGTGAPGFYYECPTCSETLVLDFGDGNPFRLVAGSQRE